MELKKTVEGEIIFRSYCLESCEIGDWCVEPFCENCGNLNDLQIDFGDSGEGMTEEWYVPVCKICGRLLPNQRKIIKSM